MGMMAVNRLGNHTPGGASPREKQALREEVEKRKREAETVSGSGTSLSAFKLMIDRRTCKKCSQHPPRTLGALRLLFIRLVETFEMRLFCAWP